MEFKEIDNELILIYYISDYASQDWIRNHLREKGNVIIKRTLNFSLTDVYPMKFDMDLEEGYFPPSAFVFGKLVGDYYCIKKSVIGTKNDFFFS
ncbi:hypothetical protein [Elizabethkingia anophelis]|uniref:hypothetical protein n=1 Tax=Elizabethkingia anophelis TaxID=1117645 RepID=UPI003892B73E